MGPVRSLCVWKDRALSVPLVASFPAQQLHAQSAVLLDAVTLEISLALSCQTHPCWHAKVHGERRKLVRVCDSLGSPRVMPGNHRHQFAQQLLHIAMTDI